MPNPLCRRQGRHPFWLYIILFLISQLSAVAVPPLARACLPAGTLTAETAMMVILLSANLLAVGLFLTFRPAAITWRSTVAGLRGQAGRRSLKIMLLSLPAIVLVNLTQEALFPDLPDLVGDETWKAIMGHPLGVSTVCLLGPLAEELLFRGGVQTDLHHRCAQQGAWVAICLGAAIFAALHLNPVQMPVTFILGCLLGFAYWWTGSLAAPVAIHVVNNSLACLLSCLSPEDDSLIRALGGSVAAGAVALACLLILAIGLRLSWEPRQLQPPTPRPSAENPTALPTEVHDVPPPTNKD